MMIKTTLALLVFAAAAAESSAVEITGTVTDRTTGAVIAHARVEFADARLAATTDESGAFTVAVPVELPATLVVSAPRYRVAHLRIAAPPAAPLAIALEPMISVTDRIEVTATRAREGTDPASFTNIPEERVAETYWGQDPAILLPSVAPGFFSYNDSGNGIGYSYFTVRGFGQALTRVTLNGAPLNDAESGELFFIDLADFLATAGDIQLQRGVFGLSGIGGALDITTASPALTPSFTLESGFGSYRTRRLAARYDSGLIDGKWALTARYSKITTDGYRDQSWVDMWNYYFSLARFGERSRLRLVLFGGPEQTHLAYAGIPKSTLDGGLTGNADRDRKYNPLTYSGEIDNFMQPHVQLVHELAISPSTQLSQTLYAFQGDGYYDEYKRNRVLAEYNLPDVKLPDGTVLKNTNLVRRRNVTETDFGWVPTLVHREGGWTFTLRGEARWHHAHHVGTVIWAQYYPQGTAPDQWYYDYRPSKQTQALAASASWNANTRLTLSAGIEYAHHAYAIGQDRRNGVSLRENFSFVLPNFGALARIGEGTEAYVRIARGMREPNLRDIYDPQDYYSTRAHLNPEDVWDYEAGASLRRPSWRARANVFYMDFKNEIVYAGALDSSGVPIYGNGAKSHHTGLELDATWTPARALGFDAALALSRNTFTSYHDFNYDGTINVYDGNRIAGYPDVLASLTARTEIAGVRLSVTGRHVGAFYLDNTEDNRRNPEARSQPGYVALRNPAYTVVDLAARAPLPRDLARTVGLDRLELDVRLNNLFDRKHTTFGYVDDGPVFTPAAGRNAMVTVKLGL